MHKKKVVLIGWDAADWKVINPLMDEGRMPALEKLVNKGVIGNLATLDPPLSPMLWTSIATGKKADKHGILGFIEPDNINGGIRPVAVTSRQTKAVWNILHYNGYKCNVVGWWPSHPAEPINGVMVSNLFVKANTPPDSPWPVNEGSVYPPEMTKILKEYRIHPAELTQQHILPFIPNAAEVDQEKDPRLASLAKITAEAASTHAIATWLMENTEWDFMAVYYDAIDHYGHAFMKYRPPRQNHIPVADFELYKDVVDGGYIFHDMMLDRLIELAGDDTTFIIVSDHGFYSDSHRPASLPRIPAAPALEHRPYGILCISGENIKTDERVYGATLLDITPTILNIYGLPSGKDMDGKVLSNIFTDHPKSSRIESWDTLPGDFGTHPPEKTEDPVSSAAALRQLIELGYLENPGEDKNKASAQAVRELKYNLSRVLASRNNYSKAIEIIEELLEDDKDEIRFQLDAIKYNIQLSEFEKALKIIEILKRKDESYSSYLKVFEGIIYSHQNRPHAALKMFSEAEKGMPATASLLQELGKVYIRLQRYEEALKIFTKVLENDDENAYAWHGLALAQLRLGFIQESAESSLNAIGLLYHFPPAHYHLGEALVRLEKFTEACQAFELSLKMNPGMYKARRWLIQIYEEKLKQKEMSEIHRIILNEQMKGKITIVSGLPRSGTSLMMQILKAGGMDILTDEIRLADESNPKGYFEYEKVKSLPRDNNWLHEAEGKALKVIAQLLRFLPVKYDYKVIFMKRDMYEIIHSQQKMLGRQQDKFPLSVAQAFDRELKNVEIWHQKEPNVKLLYVDYGDLIDNPVENICKINHFLDYQLDEDEAIKVIDKNLYRTKIR